MKGVRVDKREAEDTRIRLKLIDALDDDKIPLVEGDTVIFPIKKNVDFGGSVDREFLSSNREKSLKDMVKDKIDTSLLDKIPSSYDLVGDIVIIEIPKEIERYEDIIAEAVLKNRKNVRTVLKRAGVYKGITRTRETVFLDGENKTVTVHKENGVSIKIDVKNTYFSPRSSTERKRIAELVKEGEAIAVMFSGCAPFPLVIAKKSKAEKIIGVEINKRACELAEENVIRNKFQDRIVLYCGDVRSIFSDELREEKFDRIVMPLPKDAETFLDISLDHIKNEGMIHLYLFLNENLEDRKAEEIEEVISRYGKKGKVVRKIKCGQYGPGIFRYSFDIQIV